LKIKSQRDFVSGLLFVAVGVIFAIGATNYSMGNSARPGPGYFPLILSVIMAILGAIVLFKSLTIETEGGDPVGNIAWRPLLLIVVAIVVFAILIQRTGVFVAGAAAIGIASMADGDFRPIQTFIGTVVGLVLAYLLVVYAAPGFAWNIDVGVGWVATALAIVVRVVLAGALVLALRKALAGKFPVLADAAGMVLILLSASAWIFILGLNLTIPFAPLLGK
jgi:hypothetical protein